MKMKKIMFDDKYGLTAAVLEGRKTVTRRVCSIQPPYERSEIAFPVFAGDGVDSPLYGAFCWVNKDNPEEFTKWCKPSYREGEFVAIAQSYDEAGIHKHPYNCHHTGFRNKTHVRADLMPHRIKIKEVGIKRLQDISDEDCLKEGITSYTKDGTVHKYSWINSQIPWADMPRSPREAFAALIDKISGKGTWDKNPWVWRYEFELLKGGDNETD